MAFGKESLVSLGLHGLDVHYGIITCEGVAFRSHLQLSIPLTSRLALLRFSEVIWGAERVPRKRRSGSGKSPSSPNFRCTRCRLQP